MDLPPGGLHNQPDENFDTTTLLKNAARRRDRPGFDVSQRYFEHTAA